MNKECLHLVKVIGVYDCAIGIIVSSILTLFFNWNSWFFLLGIGCSLVNFIINSYSIQMMTRYIRFKGLLIIFSYLFRIGFICSISLAVIVKSEVSFFIFIAGYTAQFIAVGGYGFKLKNQEGM